MADQAIFQQIPAFLQTAAKRAQAPAELPGRFVLGAAFQIAQQQWQPMPLRQPLQFLIDGAEQIVPGGIAGIRFRPRLSRLTFPP